MLKNTLLRLAANNGVFGTAKKRYQSLRDRYYRALPMDDRLIVFEAFRSTKYADSPRAIYEYLLNHEDFQDYRFVWIFEHPEEHKTLEANNRTKVVKHETNGYYTAFAKAKYWVVNGWIPLRVQKKPGQVALQCWHGTPLKRLRYDIVTTNPTNHQTNALLENDKDMMRYDYLISPSHFATKAFTSAFNLKALGKEKIVIETGYPRNDVLINTTDEDYSRLREKYDIPNDKKVILYAPTWRDDQHVAGKGYEYTMPVDFDYLQKELSDEYVLLFRAHNLVANQFDFSKYDGFIKDVSKEDDINDLYIVSDILMTDYSSVFFDYANLKRPIIFYMYDLEHYQNNLRGFYLDLDELPGPIVTTETEVVQSIKKTKNQTAEGTSKQNAFYEKFNGLEDGRATERVVRKVWQK
jgi:CDP-glycerol glycerophosphotransferase